MNKIKIILEVDPDDLDWGRSAVYPTDNGVGGALLDFELDRVRYQGQTIDFVDTDDACNYLEFLWGEADHKDHAHA